MTTRGTYNAGSRAAAGSAGYRSILDLTDELLAICSTSGLQVLRMTAEIKTAAGNRMVWEYDHSLIERELPPNPQAERPAEDRQ